MNRSLTGRNVGLAGGVCVILGTALLIAYRPTAIPAGVSEPLTRGIELLGTRRIVLLTGGLLALAGGLGLAVWNRRDTAVGRDTTAVETAVRDVSITGERLTAAYNASGHTHSAEAPVETALRETLVELHTQQRRTDEAVQHVETGDWTTDAIAAATVTTTNATNFPLWYRLYEWLYPTHAYRYRIRRTVRVIETHCAASLTDSSPAAQQQGWFDQLRGRLQTDDRGDN